MNLASSKSKMKREDIRCNLCERSFSDSEFKNHFSSNHFPQKKFTCYECNAVFQYSNGLLHHLLEKHSCTEVELKKYAPKNVFQDGKDILRHAKESEHWIRYAFSYGFENPLNKKQMKSRIEELYRDNADKTNTSMCRFCRDTDAPLYCYFCGKSFTILCSLKSHVLNSHLLLPNSLKVVASCGEMRSAVLEEHSPKKKESPFCQYCGKSLANKSNLKRHILKQHSEQVGATPVIDVFTCHHCKCLFSNKSSVKRHIENVHLKKKDTRKSISCFQCEQEFNSIKNLNAHLTVEHGVQIREEKVHFPNLSEFWSWKQQEEIKTNSRYIQLRGLRKRRQKGEEVSTMKFVCNRSGIFHSKSNGKRAYRVKGSSKIGRYCSSYIEIMFKENASVDGAYCSTHSGHNNDLRYLALTTEEKREIYEKIRNGASFSSILNEIRNNVGKEITRKHLVTNKDLHNIVSTFKKLPKPNSDPNEAASNRTNSSSNVHEAEYGSFNNDLDICANLWVETCPRMVDQADPDAGTSTELCSHVDSEESGVTMSNFKEEIYSVIEPDRVKSETTFSEQYSSAHTSILMQPGPSETNVWKQPHPYSSQEVNLVDAHSSSQYSTLPEAHRDLHDYCSLSTMEEVQVHTLYPSDASEAAGDASSSVRVDSYYAAGSLDIESAQSTFEKSTNLSPQNVFHPYVIQEIVCESCPEKSDIRNADFEVQPSCEEKTESSDLRDRVNSVTALFNIVESELDERKKNMIRSYVDGMFRVLQYRYNKCKTKKQSKCKKSLAQKRLNRRRGNVSNQKVRTKQKCKPCVQKHFSRQVFLPKRNFERYSEQCGFGSTINADVRSDGNVMRWDQY